MPSCAPRDVRSAHEPPVVRRALDLEHGVVHLPARPGERLLELRLVVDVARARVLDLVGEGLDDRRLDLLEAVLEVERSDGRLEHRGQHVAAPRDALELVRRDAFGPLEQLLPEAELLRNDGTALAGDDVRPDLRQAPLRRVGEAVEDGPCDRELEHAVAEELEPLVRRPARSSAHEACVKTCSSRCGGSSAISRPSSAGPPWSCSTPGAR